MDLSELSLEQLEALKAIKLRKEMQKAFTASGAPGVPMPKVDVQPVANPIGPVTMNPTASGSPFASVATVNQPNLQRQVNPEDPQTQELMRMAGGVAGLASGGGSVPISLGMGVLGAATTKTPGDLLATLIPGAKGIVPGLKNAPFSKGAIGGALDVAGNKLTHEAVGEATPESKISTVATPAMGAMMGGITNKYGSMAQEWGKMLKDAQGGIAKEKTGEKLQKTVDQLTSDASIGKQFEGTQKNVVKGLRIDLKEALRKNVVETSKIRDSVTEAERELIKINQGNVENTSILSRYQQDLAKNKREIDKTMNDLKIPVDHPLRKSITPSMVWMIAHVIPTMSTGVAVAAVISKLSSETHDPNTFAKLADFYARKKASSEQIAKLQKALPFIVNAEKNLEPSAAPQ